MNDISFSRHIAAATFVIAILFTAYAVGQDAQVDAEGCTPIVMEAAKESEGTPYLVETEKFLIIGNDRVAAAFSRVSFDLIALVNVAEGGTAISKPAGMFWRMTLSDASRSTVEVKSTDVARRTYVAERNAGKVTLNMTWRNIAVGEEPNIVDAKVSISAEAGSALLRWRIRINNRSMKRGLWEVDFPLIESIAPMGDPEKSALLSPGPQGRAIPNPFGMARTFEGKYPGPFSFAPMQFSALYGPAGGLYLAAHDGRMFIKKFYHLCSKQKGTVTYYLRNLPENRGDAGVDFEMPYDFVMTTFQGDWFDACRLYREWAIKQVWCSKGPIHKRADIPEWYKKIGFWMIAWEQHSHRLWADGKVPVGEKNQTIEDIKTISEIIGVPLAVHYYGWHRYPFDYKYPEFFPPLSGDEGFKKEAQALNEAGIRMVPYINACIYDKALPSYKEQNVLRYCRKDEHGNSHNWPIPHTAAYEAENIDVPISYFDWVCPYTAFWQARMREISEKLVGEYGVPGIYYDVLSGSCLECFDPGHGHTKGGGNYWAIGNRKLLQLCRDSVRKINPDVMMTSENVNEVYIDKLDSFLLFCNQYWPGAVPAFQAVYHDYAITFGNCVIGGERDVQSLTMPVGESFVNGDQLGWFNIRPDLLAYRQRKMSGKEERTEEEKKRDKYAEFVIHIAHLRQNAGLKFLAFGEMLRALQFENELPVVEGKWADPPDVRRMPAVLNSVWKAPDGTLGLVFCNIDINESAHAVRYAIDVTDCGLPEGRTYLLVERSDEGGEKVLEKYSSAIIKRTETLPSLRGLILEIRAQ